MIDLAAARERADMVRDYIPVPRKLIPPGSALLLPDEVEKIETLIAAVEAYRRDTILQGVREVDPRIEAALSREV